MDGKDFSLFIRERIDRMNVPEVKALTRAALAKNGIETDLDVSEFDGADELREYTVTLKLPVAFILSIEDEVERMRGEGVYKQDETVIASLIEEAFIHQFMRLPCEVVSMADHIGALSRMLGGYARSRAETIKFDE